MLKSKYLFALALFIPLVGAALPAEAQKKNSGDAARAECFRQAQEAANAVMGENAEKNARGASAYRACTQKAGIRQ